jgi:hypothetical protein
MNNFGCGAPGVAVLKVFWVKVAAASEMGIWS